MKYENICRGKFIERPNRFVAVVDIDGRICRAHVKNTGRCRELLIPGADVFLEDFSYRMGSRKLKYSLIGVKKKTSSGILMINMDSQAPNKVVGEALEQGCLVPRGLENVSLLKSEYKYGNSRIDFLAKDRRGAEALIEVKGVTLEKNGTAMFPDAPTARGIKHIEELIAAKKAGYSACIIFVIQMKEVESFRPNDRTHPEFGRTLAEAQKKGVEILACSCIVEEDALELNRPVKVIL